MTDARPNVVLFMTDQQRGATVLPEHRLKAHTPHLDALRADGVTFSRAYTVSPHCCPSRTSFFTGLYPTEHGVWNNVQVANALSRGPVEDTPFWSTTLRDAGYQLGFVGKWHVSATSGPAAVGWQECMITGAPPHPPGTTEAEQRRTARAGDLRRLSESRTAADHRRAPGEIVRPGYLPYRHYTTAENPFNDEGVIDAAVDFIDAGQDRPWCLYVGTLGPHDPYQPPQRFLDQYDPDEIELPDNFADTLADKPGLYRRIRDRFDQLTEAEHREALRHYLAFCSYEDELFGRVHAAVERSGQLANTIFVYLSDHGDYAGDHGLWCKGLPPFESALHIPLIISSPQTPPELRGSQVDDLVSIVDLGPTLLDLCQVTPETTMSGVSVADRVLSQQAGDQQRSEVFFQSNGNETYGNQRVIMDDRWKLVINFFDGDELYDLAEDPDEMVNLLYRPADERRVGVTPDDQIPVELRPVVADLYQRFWRHAVEHEDELTHNYIMTALGTYGPGVALAHPLP